MQDDLVVGFESRAEAQRFLEEAFAVLACHGEEADGGEATRD
jgi:hypothetical protein